MDPALAAPVAPRVPAPVPPFTEWSGGVRYPSSDGRPMSENTRQDDWMNLIRNELKWLFPPPADVFVAADLLWYPVQGDPTIRMGPDVMVALGRPQGHRSSYKQWEEDGLAPQVIFEIISPGNRQREIARKLAFYDRYGVVEYYTYNPFPRSGYELRAWRRGGGGAGPGAGAGLEELALPVAGGWRSPLLGIGFERAGGVAGGELRLVRPDGQPFRSFLDVSLAEEQARRRAAREAARARAERTRAQAYAAKLRALGVDPETL